MVTLACSARVVRPVNLVEGDAMDALALVTPRSTRLKYIQKHTVSARLLTDSHVSAVLVLR